MSLYGKRPATPQEYENRCLEIAELEAKAIEYVFDRHGVNARVDDQTCVINRQFFAFAIDTLGGTRGGVGDVISRQRELSNAITRMRGEETMVRVQEVPLMVEVPNPWPRPLLPDDSLFDVGPHRMLAGVQYNPFTGIKPMIFDFGKGQHHFLVAGASGAGKSVLQNMMVLSLATGAMPKDLRMVLVDLKGMDLPKYAVLPHVANVVTTVEDAEAMIYDVRAELEWRKHNFTPTLPRLVLVVDELAELRNSPGAVDALNSILALGRGLKVNCLLATQYPTKDTLGGVRLDNVSVRISGSVADAKIAALVTGRPGTGAELLPLNSGAFVASYGNQAQRLQAYLLEDDSAIVQAERIAVVCNAEVKRGQYVIPPAFHAAPSRPSHRRVAADTAPIRTDIVPDISPDTVDISVNWAEFGDLGVSEKVDISDTFPIGFFRTLTADECAAVRRMATMEQFKYAGKPALGPLAIAVFGSRNPDRTREIDRALAGDIDDSKVIRLPQRAAQGR